MDATDSLPYYDTDIDRIPGALRPCRRQKAVTDIWIGLREKLEAEIEAELAAVPLDDVDISSRLPSELPELFTSSDFLRSELARISSGSKPPRGTGLDSVRYTLPAPPGNAPEEAWKKALDNAGSQLEHQQLRLGNLELMQKYGSNAWRVANFLVEKEIERIEKQTEEVKLRTEELNRERKARQASLSSTSRSATWLTQRNPFYSSKRETNCRRSSQDGRHLSLAICSSSLRICRWISRWMLCGTGRRNCGSLCCSYSRARQRKVQRRSCKSAVSVPCCQR